MDAVAAYILDHRVSIVSEWEGEVSGLSQLQGIPRPAIIDHLPEFLAGLAHWVAGDVEAAEQGFAALIEGHALQRLGFDIDLGVLIREYAALRRVLLRRLMAVDAAPAVRESLVRLNEGMDHATNAAIRRYTGRRAELQSRFIDILTHDLRNPLGAIVAGTEALLMRAPDPATTKVAARMRSAARRMARMIESLMDLARSHGGEGMPMVPVPGDLGEMAAAATEEMGMAHPDRPIHLEIEGELDGAWDRDRVVQALSNLVSNAVTHGHGPVLVRAIDEGPEHVVTEVINQGPVIPPGELPRLFEPFHRIPGTATGPRGLGLGLFIVRQIALAHGATTEVTSSVEQGTCFRIRWPRTQGQPAGRAVAPSPVFRSEPLELG